MATLADFRDERIKKLEKLRELGIDPFPAKSSRTIKCGEINEETFAKLENSTQTIAGRIVSLRSFGKLAFIVIRDISGEIQLFLKADNIDGAESEPDPGLKMAEMLKLLDTGDFVQATGAIAKTQTGEISVIVKKLKMLAKSLRPLPGRDGFTNKEERLRRRYIDMNVNPEVRERFVRRAKFWQATREFLMQNGFIEINIPVLEHTTGGADANAFKTHMDALDEDFYLRISQELPLKRLIGAGFEKVFDIGPRFRNEGIDDEHLPEHISMESYAAYEDYEDGMKLYEAMIKFVAKETWGTLQFIFAKNEKAEKSLKLIREKWLSDNSDRNFAKLTDYLIEQIQKEIKFSSYDGITTLGKDDFEIIDLNQDWPRIKYADIMKDKFDIDVFAEDTEENREKLREILRREKREFDPSAKISRLLDNVWKIIRESSAGPFWLIHEPAAISPLAKREPTDPRVTQRFHPIILGTEMGNGFSELNDPIDQLARFREQQKLRDGGDNEAMMLDIDFVEMLEYGMPPTCGWGNSERNFWLLEGVSAREGVPFPAMRREISEVTRKIYSGVKLD